MTFFKRNPLRFQLPLGSRRPPSLAETTSPLSVLTHAEGEADLSLL